MAKRFEVGDTVEFEAVFDGDCIRESFGATVVRRTDKSVWLAYNNRGDGQRYLIREHAGYESINVSNVGGYQLVTSRTVRPPHKEVEPAVDAIIYNELSYDDKHAYSRYKAMDLLDYIIMEPAECPNCHGDGTYTYRRYGALVEDTCHYCNGIKTVKRLGLTEVGEIKRADAMELTDKQKRVKCNIDALALLDKPYPYGKHKGTLYRDLSIGYCEWAWDAIGCKNSIAEELVFELIAMNRVYEFERYMVENKQKSLDILNG